MYENEKKTPYREINISDKILNIWKKKKSRKAGLRGDGLEKEEKNTEKKKKSQVAREAGGEKRRHMLP